MQDVPASYHHYFPSWEEWAIAIGSLSGALLIITFFARIYPIIPIQETITEKLEESEEMTHGKAYQRESEYYEKPVLTPKEQAHEK